MAEGASTYVETVTVGASLFRDANPGVASQAVLATATCWRCGGVNDAGSLALIDTDVLESATPLAGAYPRRAGAHLGARLDVTSRDGARDRTRGRTLLSATAVTGSSRARSAGRRCATRYHVRPPRRADPGRWPCARATWTG